MGARSPSIFTAEAWGTRSSISPASASIASSGGIAVSSTTSPSPSPVVVRRPSLISVS